MNTKKTPLWVWFIIGCLCGAFLGFIEHAVADDDAVAPSSAGVAWSAGYSSGFEAASTFILKACTATDGLNTVQFMKDDGVTVVEILCTAGEVDKRSLM